MPIEGISRFNGKRIRRAANARNRSLWGSHGFRIPTFWRFKKSIWKNPKISSCWLNHPFEKYARQIGNLPQIEVNIKHIWNHHLGRFTIYIMLFGYPYHVFTLKMKEDEATNHSYCSSVQLPWQSKSTSYLNDFCKDYCFSAKVYNQQFWGNIMLMVGLNSRVSLPWFPYNPWGKRYIYSTDPWIITFIGSM